METKTIEVSSFSISLDSFPDEICEKIQSYRNRKEGWHYGEGLPAKDEAINLALDMVKYYRELSFTRVNAFLGLDGAISVNAYNEHLHAEAIITNISDVEFYMEHDGEEIEYIESTTIHEAKERLYQGLKRLWNSQESSKRNISITTSVDLKVWQSETLPPLFQLSA